MAVAVLTEPADAEDVCQDAFITALEQLDTCRQPDHFGSWLLRIVRNRAISAQRRRKVRDAIPLEWAEHASGTGSPAADADRSLLRDRLSTAVATLPERQREVLLLHDLEGWKHREIGDLLNLPEGTVRNLLFQARRAMRQELGESLYKES